jgi:hypothetical protein
MRTVSVTVRTEEEAQGRKFIVKKGKDPMERKNDD